MQRTRTRRFIVGGRGVRRSGTSVAARKRAVGTRQTRRIRRRWRLGLRVSREENTGEALPIFSTQSSMFALGRRIAGIRGFFLRRSKGFGEERRIRVRGEARRRRSRGQLGAVARREVTERWERYLGRERRSLSTYVRVAYSRGSAYATEAGRKYFRVGALGSTRIVRGRVRIYGETGRIKRPERWRWGEISRSSSIEISHGRGRKRRRWVRWFKRGARPIHRWVADIYEGAPSRIGRYRRRVPKRAVSRRRVRRRGGLSRRGEQASQIRGRRAIRATGTRRIGGRGLAVQRRWKRYRAYSGRSTVGQRRRGGRRRTVQGEKGRRRTLRIYFQRVRRTWGTRRRIRVQIEGFDGRPGKGKIVREIKYRKDRGGRRKENVAIARRRIAARMSLAGRPPRVGFGAKRAVYGGRVNRSRSNFNSSRSNRNIRGVTISNQSRWRTSPAVRGGLARRRSRVSAYGYLRFAKRRTIEGRVVNTTVFNLEKKTQGIRGMEQGRLIRKREKSIALRRGLLSRRRALGWLNGEGIERRRDRVVRY